MKSKTIKVEYLARVEGEGALFVKIRGKKVEEVRMSIFEPPRFFEAFLRGRDRTEAPDITARIGGICPVAFQMSAVHAIEAAAGVQVTGALRALRRLLYCGEWIESHVLHIYMLHAPDFLGCQDAMELAQDHPGAVQRALEMKKIGNQIVALLGGREIHPINVRTGGFYRVPNRRDFDPLIERLKWARDAAAQTIQLTGTFPCPDFTPDYTFVALHHPNEYALNEGRLISSNGLDITAAEYENHFTESHVAHSNALHSTLNGTGNYLVGPLARFTLNYQQLSPTLQQMARDAGLSPGCRNPFKSIVARSVETWFACDEAIRIMTHYEPPATSAVELPVRAGIGHAITEASRGILYHRYNIGADGRIVEARIVPPTAQNQKTIEEDLRALVESMPELPKNELTWKCEQAVRNYDPCISCATH